jgi:uncharacterized protein YqjF (DUF2071 family)
VYFYSLDCNQPLAVELAKRVLNLEYRHAKMNMTTTAGLIDFTCRRRGSNVEEIFSYRLVRPIGIAPEDERCLEFFLIERYRLFAPSADGQIISIGVSHDPYQLFDAEVKCWSPQALRQAGFAVAGAPDHVCGAAPLVVQVLPPETQSV